ncbi:MAG: UV damage endonuclease UvsE [Anaerolineae bacterium]
MRLGCGPALLARPGLRCYDARRPPAQPHLSVGLLYLRDALAWLARADVHLFRLHWRLLPDPAEVAPRQLAEAAAELAWVGGLARAGDVRLTVHAPLSACLGGRAGGEAAHAAATLSALAGLLAGLGAQDGVVECHVGGGLGDADGARARFAQRYLALPPDVRRYVAVEHDLVHAAGDLVGLHAVCGVPVIFDSLHHRLRGDGRAPRAALAACLATWPPGVTPLVHVASPRTEVHPLRRRGARVVRLPRPGEHADLIHPFEFQDFLAATQGLPPFDIMLEARASDVALLRLRAGLRRTAPDLAAALR